MRTVIILISSFFVLVNVHAASAWELGLGMGGLSIPDYPGSNRQQTYVSPFPYFIYNGRYLSVNGKGITGTLFKSPRLNMDFSVDAGTSVDSDQNKMRHGMPDLDPNVQIGPSLNYLLYKTSRSDSFKLMFPVRFVIAANNHDFDMTSADSYSFNRLHSEGWLFHPQVNWYGKRRFLTLLWNLRASVGPMFVNNSYSDYFYSIDSAYAETGRPAYDAGAGYAGTRFFMTFSPSLKEYWLGGFVRLDALHGSTFEASPLVAQKYSLTVGIGFAWIFASSS